MSITIKKGEDIILYRYDIKDLEITTYKNNITISFNKYESMKYEITLDIEKTPDYEITIR